MVGEGLQMGAEGAQRIRKAARIHRYEPGVFRRVNTASSLKPHDTPKWDLSQKRGHR